MVPKKTTLPFSHHLTQTLLAPIRGQCKLTNSVGSHCCHLGNEMANIVKTTVFTLKLESTIYLTTEKLEDLTQNHLCVLCFSPLNHGTQVGG